MFDFIVQADATTSRINRYKHITRIKTIRYELGLIFISANTCFNLQSRRHAGQSINTTTIKKHVKS